MQPFRLYSIGHSNQTQERFLSMLKKYDINCVVDVRSVPASKYSPQFNQELLKCFLRSNDIEYLNFGEEFGARRTDSINADGQVDFEYAVRSPAFMRGVARLDKGLEKGYRISLMCSEANPLECHRFSLVSRYFHNHGVDVEHIMKDASLVPHATLEREMVNEYLHSRKFHLSEIDMLFGTYTEAEQLRDAYRLKNKEIGYKPEMKEEELYL